MARSKIRAVKEEPLTDHDFDALPEEEEATAAELQELLEREKDTFITFEEYAKRRGIKL
jgi:hypothetical protein